MFGIDPRWLVQEARGIAALSANPRGAREIHDDSNQGRLTDVCGYKDVGTSISNQNTPGEIDPGTEERLRTERVFTRHAGFEFNAIVWFEDDKFHSEVWRFHEPVAVLHGDTLEAVVREACEKYGDD